jgi:hypothetical protein
MESSESLLRERALRAYLRGRRLYALRIAFLVLPVAVALPLLGTSPRLGLVAGVLLLLTTFAFALRGGLHFRTLAPGLAAGSVAWLLPTLPRCAYGFCPAGVCLALCVSGSFVGGLLAGLVLARRTRQETAHPGIFLACAAWVALLLGTSACVVAGGWGVAGLLAGGLAGTSRALVGARAS